MKTTIFTIIVLFVFNADVLFAGGVKRNTNKPETDKVPATIDMLKLVPATPTFAEFCDGSETNTLPEGLDIKLAPVTPTEAEFEDLTEMEEPEAVQAAAPFTLAPVTPTEGDFTE